MRGKVLLTLLIFLVPLFAGCLGEKETSFSENGFITEGWLEHFENDGTNDHFGIPVLHAFSVEDGKKVSIQSAVVSLNFTDNDEDEGPRINNDQMIFTIQCDDGSEYVSGMASPLPSGEGECQYTITNNERWFPENGYEVHSVSWSLTYSIE